MKNALPVSEVERIVAARSQENAVELDTLCRLVSARAVVSAVEAERNNSTVTVTR